MTRTVFSIKIADAIDLLMSVERQTVERCLTIAREEELAARGTIPENGRHEVMLEGYGNGLEELRTRLRAEFSDVLEAKAMPPRDLIPRRLDFDGNDRDFPPVTFVQAAVEEEDD